MNGGNNISDYLQLSPLKKIRIRNSHPLLDTGIVYQYIYIAMVIGNPVVQRQTISFNRKIADLADNGRIFIRYFF